MYTLDVDDELENDVGDRVGDDIGLLLVPMLLTVTIY